MIHNPPSMNPVFSMYTTSPSSIPSNTGTGIGTSPGHLHNNSPNPGSSSMPYNYNYNYNHLSSLSSVSSIPITSSIGLGFPVQKLGMGGQTNTGSGGLGLGLGMGQSMIIGNDVQNNQRIIVQLQKQFELNREIIQTLESQIQNATKELIGQKPHAKFINIDADVEELTDQIKKNKV